MKMKWWLKGLMTCTHENFLKMKIFWWKFFFTGNVNRSYQSCVILYCNQNLRWCALSGVRVCSFEPAPRELKARKTPSKIKSKRLLKREKYVSRYCRVDIEHGFRSGIWTHALIRGPTWQETRRIIYVFRYSENLSSAVLLIRDLGQ